MNWNFGAILNAVERAVPADRPALIHGERVLAWGDFARRSTALAGSLLAGGARPGEKIGFYLRNCSEYPEGIAAAFKAGLVHVNVNYRYVEDELVYLLDNADATAVIYAAEFAPRVAAIRDRLPDVRQWIEVADGEPGLPDAIAYEDLATAADGTIPDGTLGDDDLLFLYTGGTTGMPKGVMWRHDDLWRAMGAGGNPRLGIPPCADLDEFIGRIGAEPVTVALPLPPIMHGTGLLSAIGAFCRGGTCVTLPARSFDAREALDAMDRHRVTTVSIVGDAFARPLLEALDAEPSRWDISSLKAMTSSGVMWTRDVKAGLLRHAPEALLVDGFSSSEAIGLGSSVMSRAQTVEVAKFTRGPNCRVFSEDGREILPGENEPGMVAVTGFLPLGYYKDPEKTAKTFRVFDGVRYSVPGDWVTVEADGTLNLLGRGSNCINTAGEKVYPEEVEEALKQHPEVADALVVGLPDPKWGQSITAVVQPNGNALDETALRGWIRGRIAAYKVPKRILVKADLGRAPNGKADYKAIRAFAEGAVAAADRAAAPS